MAKKKIETPKQAWPCGPGNHRLRLRDHDRPEAGRRCEDCDYVDGPRP